MGDPRKLSKKYERPKHPWLWKNLKDENELIDNYGLKSKKEVWKAQSKIRKFRKRARNLVGLPEEERMKKEKNFLEKLRKNGIIKERGELDDVLEMTTKDYLERRLQTQAWRKGYGKTPQEARQLIVHGHIELDGRRVTKPSIIVPKDKEDTIDWYGSPVEQAKAEETTEELIEEAKEKKQIPKGTKEKEETEEEKEEEEKEEIGELKYDEIVKENIPDVKEKAKEGEIDYEKLLEAEKDNKDRKTLKKWINRRIGE